MTQIINRHIYAPGMEGVPQVYEAAVQRLLADSDAALQPERHDVDLALGFGVVNLESLPQPLQRISSFDDHDVLAGAQVAE